MAALTAIISFSKLANASEPRDSCYLAAEFIISEFGDGIRYCVGLDRRSEVL